MLDGIEDFLQSPSTERAEELLLSLSELPIPQTAEQEQLWDRVLLACAQTPAVLGENLGLLSEAWRQRFWQVCLHHPQDTCSALEGLREGPYASELAALLERQASPVESVVAHQPPSSEIGTVVSQPKKVDWKLELSRLIEQWNRCQGEQIDLQPTLARVGEVLKNAREFSGLGPEEESRSYLKLTLDLGLAEHRSLAAMFWTPASRATVLRQVAEALQAQELAHDREALLGWLLERENAAEALDDFVQILGIDERDELLRRLRAAHRERDATQVMSRWLMLGLPLDASRLATALDYLRKHWKLREFQPELVDQLANAACDSLLRLSAQHRQAVEGVLEILEHFRDLAPRLEKALLDRVFASEGVGLDQVWLLRCWLASRPDEQALLQVCRWAGLYSGRDLLWPQLLDERSLPSSERLADLLGPLRSPSEALLETLYRTHVEKLRQELLALQEAKRASLGSRLAELWDGLMGGLAALLDAWAEARGLATRVAQVQEACRRPELSQLCPALWEEPAELLAQPDVHGSGVEVSWLYAQQQWSEWTGLPMPQPEQLTDWLQQAHSAEDLGDVAFAWASTHLEGQAPESDRPCLAHFLEQIQQYRTDAADWLRENVGGALAMLPFQNVFNQRTDLPTPPATPLGTNHLQQLLAVYDQLCQLQRRMAQQEMQFQHSLQLELIKKLGPGLDNLEQYLLPYFQFRQMLQDNWHIHPSAPTLNQKVPNGWVGTRVRVVANDDHEGPLFTHTLGLCLLDEELARWPAYVAPRPRQ